MFDIFRRKKQIKENPNYYLKIEFRNGKILGYEVESNELPPSYKKIIHWFYGRKGQKYVFRHRNGAIIFNRDDLLTVEYTRK